MDLGKKIYIYRLCHIDNVPHILQFGITRKNSPNANPNYISIGDSSLISIRERKRVKLSDTQEEINLGDCIPFYFGGRMPMLYVINKGYNFVPKTVRQQDLIYCVSSVDKILELNLDFIFSDGHATDRLTEFFSKNKIEEIDKIIDFNAVRERYWNNENDLDLKRRKQAEFLVREDIPTEAILGYICYDNETKKKLLNFGVKVKIYVDLKKNFYF